jgi:hypothetical protein
LETALAVANRLFARTEPVAESEESHHNMKELQTILAALHKARDIVGRYAMPGDRNAESAMNELLGVLDSEELGCALERVETRLGSSSIAPEIEQSENTAA